MATLKDISRHLNLSVTQVSRALNGYSDVNENTRKRVLEAAKELNYHPNIAAQKLVSGRSGMVALVLPKHPQLSSDNNFLEVVSGLSQVFSGRDMQFVLHIAREDDEIISVYRKLIDRGALDGFVVVEPLLDDPRINFLRERGVPFVVHGRTRTQTDYPYYDIDNDGVGFALTRHLIDKGHRRIAFINGLEKRNYSLARTDGYRKALEESGIEFDPDLIRYGRMNDALGMISTVQFFTGASPRPTAVICGNTLVARGVYATLKSLGLSVPDDVSVVAHDDVLPDVRGSAFYPALTVTKAALRNSWAPMAAYLVGAINGEPVEDLQEVAASEFIERASVAPPKR
jgi:LacI family transcriptional regulator